MILTINAGSSSLKYGVYDLDKGDNPVLNGLFEGLDADGESHEIAFKKLAGELQHRELLPLIKAVGHRIVHGGDTFSQATLLSAEVIKTLEEFNSLAPLHNPINLDGVRLTQLVLAKAQKSVPHVAVFDTAFHSSIPEVAFRYPIPEQWYKAHRVRKYGFHGTSHAYVAGVAQLVLAKAKQPSSRIISLHLGNGCSAAAIQRGRCIDTTMGLTPLAGLMMGTRSGDIDPGIAAYLDRVGISVQEQEKLLNKSSGLHGIAGDNDMRKLLDRRDQGDAGAKLAVAMFTYRLRKTIGAFTAALGGLDALLFTAGIGENASVVRAEICKDLSFLGIDIDPQKNEERSKLPRDISKGSCRVMVIPTKEEYAIAMATRRVLA